MITKLFLASCGYSCCLITTYGVIKALFKIILNVQEPVNVGRQALPCTSKAVLSWAATATTGSPPTRELMLTKSCWSWVDTVVVAGCVAAVLEWRSSRRAAAREEEIADLLENIRQERQLEWNQRYAQEKEERDMLRKEAWNAGLRAGLQRGEKMAEERVEETVKQVEIAQKRNHQVLLNAERQKVLQMSQAEKQLEAKNKELQKALDNERQKVKGMEQLKHHAIQLKELQVTLDRERQKTKGMEDERQQHVAQLKELQVMLDRERQKAKGMEQEKKQDAIKQKELQMTLNRERQVVQQLELEAERHVAQKKELQMALESELQLTQEMERHTALRKERRVVKGSVSKDQQQMTHEGSLRTDEREQVTSMGPSRVHDDQQWDEVRAREWQKEHENRFRAVFGTQLVTFPQVTSAAAYETAEAKRKESSTRRAGTLTAKSRTTKTEN